MPARAFRITISNDSTYLVLNHAFDHLCHGDWTDGWQPPQQISAGGSGGFQSESAGVWTGTEGYVKYDVAGNDGSHGMVYAYWDNPYYGVTQFRFVASGGDVTPDCDYDSNGGSTFNSPANDFTLKPTGFRHTEGGGDITSPGDLGNWIVGPASLFGLEGIVKDPELLLALRDQEPSFQNLGPETLGSLDQATITDWVGDWRTDRVEIGITRSGSNELTISINDNLAQPSFTLTAVTTVGPSSLHRTLQGHKLSEMLGHENPGGKEGRLFQEAAYALAGQVVAVSSRPALASRYERLVDDLSRGVHGVNVSLGAAAKMGRNVANLIADSTSTLWLSDGVVLSLYGVFQDGSRVSERLQYQRIHEGGVVFADHMLQRHYEIR
jgi:hypothetical protein